MVNRLGARPMGIPGDSTTYPMFALQKPFWKKVLHKANIGLTFFELTASSSFLA